ncbi:MAG: hypothetical protein AEth_00347 [Candidatus Argoarchaeum ethanivorans]|uniref:Uncharacterized protein n=2 Tax=Candidatus Argoarchaeum ethanivorans TaxID=2608793 RepID=A0A8B3S418_9EURY|nr:MAG: hypothetical protein AEth_00347 [Candidatus Argoarchaeum ethanivorans]
MDVIQDGKNTAMRIEEKLERNIKSEEEFNKKILKQNKFISFFTVLIFLLTLFLVILTIKFASGEYNRW